MATTTDIATPLSAEAIEARVTGLQHKLAESGQRATPQRLHVLGALLAVEDHPTAEIIWDRVSQISPTTTLATVYKALDTLREMGEVLELDTRSQSRHYDAVHPEPHPHAVCRRCGRIDDVSLTGLEDLQSKATEASGYQIEEQSVTFYGLCRACQEAEKHGKS